MFHLGWRAFDRAWFARHQQTLLWLLAAPVLGRIMRWALCIRPHDVGYRRRIVQILPHAYIVANGNGTQTLDCRTHAKYGKRIYYAGWPVWWAMHAFDWAIADRWVPALSCGFATLTAYPDAGDPGAASVDGTAYRVVASETFAALRNGAGTGAYSLAATDTAPFLGASGTLNEFGTMQRGFFGFNTSALGPLAVVSAATMSQWFTTTTTGLGDTTVQITAGPTASNTTLASGDYATIGRTAYATGLTISAITTGAYTDAVLNGSGIAAVNIGGVTKIATQLGWDLASSFTGTWASSAQTSASVTFADQTGSANDPKLEVTYSLQGRNRVTRDQNRISAVGNFTNSASTSLAFLSAVSAGQLLTCCITGGSSAVNVSTIVDTVNSSGKWKLAIRQRSTVVNSSLFSEIWYAVNSSAGTPTVTVTLASTAAGRFLFGIQSWSNADTSANVLGTVGATAGNSSNAATPTLSSISSGSVVVACWKTSAGVTNVANPTGWSTIAPQNSTRENTFYQLQTSTTAISTKWQYGAAAQYVVALAEFRGSTFTPSTAANRNDGCNMLRFGAC